MQAALPPPVIDAMVQTDDLLLRDGSCQTDQPKEIDFPIQADLQSEKEAVSSIKEENMEVVFRVPTEDSSSDSFSDDSSSDSWLFRDSEDKNSSNDLEKSEVRKIYCRYEDPKNAIEKIKELENCLSVHDPQQNQDAESFIESENQFQLETAVKTIWRFFGLTTIPNKDFSPGLNAIKSFISPGGEYLEYDKILDAFKLISQCCTTIKMIQPYGYEYWIVKDFEKGPEISKWYLGQAIDASTAEKLAFLNLAGIKIPEVGEKGRRWHQWTDFVRRLASDQGIIFIHITWIINYR